MKAWARFCAPRRRFVGNGPQIRQTSVLGRRTAVAAGSSKIRDVIVLLRLLARLELFHALVRQAGDWPTPCRRASPGACAPTCRRQHCPDQAAFRRILRANIVETSKQALEYVPLWFRSSRTLLRWCAPAGERAVLDAYREGRGASAHPHLGCRGGCLVRLAPFPDHRAVARRALPGSTFIVAAAA